MTAVVRDVMSALPLWVSETASFREIAAKLRECRVSAFPVLDADGKVTGVVSEADLLVKEAVQGNPETIAIGHDLVWRARHVEGVVAMRDRLVYPVPPVPVAPGPYF
jgi:CBS-domain-containing membrane protein